MAVDPLEFFDVLSHHGVDFFTGVPDSLLKEFCLCLDDQVPRDRHIIAANEGNAVAIAAGHYLATENLSLVYMQNSGLGNAINPFLSLCDPDVYAIPLLVLVGWRGEPGIKDEPQHVKQGRVQNQLLEAMGYPYEVIAKDERQTQEKVSRAVKCAIGQSGPSFLLIRKGTFDAYRSRRNGVIGNLMQREEALEIILNRLADDCIIVSTTGKTSREIFEIRERYGHAHDQDFLTVGSMGHCSSIALGIALAKPHRRVLCIDGDGAMLMHMGSLAVIGNLRPKNFFHILVNNQVHESVGEQETAAKNLDMAAIAESNRYEHVLKVLSREELEPQLDTFLGCDGPAFLDLRVRPGSRENLGRPTIPPKRNRAGFMSFLQD